MRQFQYGGLGIRGFMSYQKNHWDSYIFNVEVSLGKLEDSLLADSIAWSVHL